MEERAGKDTTNKESVVDGWGVSGEFVDIFICLFESKGLERSQEVHGRRCL